MTERTDRELLELAAKAEGRDLDQWKWEQGVCPGFWKWPKTPDGHITRWNPLHKDGDALRLAVKLNMDIHYESCADGVCVTVVGAWDGAPEPVDEVFENDGSQTVRRAVVRAAAAMAEGGPNASD